MGVRKKRNRKMETDVTKMVKRKRDKGKINSDWKRENEQWLLKILISKIQ